MINYIIYAKNDNNNSSESMDKCVVYLKISLKNTLRFRKCENLKKKEIKRKLINTESKYVD